MRQVGVLERMARADLDALVEAVAADYPGGALESLTVQDPAWRARLEAVEGEVGALYASLCEADAALARWRQAVGELHRLWRRVGDVSVLVEAPALEDVA